ncbi:MAG: helix-turn-helix domain-containing protein [Nitrospina sp.]|jgi:hypothetical protein|nr:helix-turn-helix domain-containing protein [Nitrospina sp.]
MIKSSKSNNLCSFKWTENVRNGLSFRLPRKIIDEGYWSNLSSASKAVYLPLLKFTNKQGAAWPSQRTLAIVSGVTEKTAGKGIKGLNGLPGFGKKQYITRRGHTANHYHIKEPAPDYDHTIWFSHDYINGGNWSQLTPAAKAVFPVLKSFAWWDLDMYCDLEDIPYTPNDFSQMYKYRDYDFMNAEEPIICERAGISRRSLPDTYRNLVNKDFIEPLGVDGEKKIWKVFISPTQYYKRDALNQKAEKRYGSESFTR